MHCYTEGGDAKVRAEVLHNKQAAATDDSDDEVFFEDLVEWS